MWRLSLPLCASDTIFTTHPSAARMQAPCRLEYAPASSVDELVAFAVARGVTLAVVGPEAPLAEGITGELRERATSTQS